MPKQAINEIRCTFLSRSENEALARSIISGFLLPLDQRGSHQLHRTRLQRDDGYDRARRQIL